ncbi:SufE family protein [Candidatus Karelsulcia muelleri]
MTNLLHQEQRTLILLDYLKQNKMIYNYLITIGNTINCYKPHFLKPQNILNGCQSKVWVYFIYKKNTLYVFTYSHSLIIMGLSFLITNIYSNNLPFDIIKHNPALMYKSLFRPLLRYNRTNTIQLIVNKIKQEAFKWYLSS